MPLTEGQTFAGYTVVRLLGAGGMGEVYLVQHPRLPRQDALKILGAEVTTDEAYRKRFLLEAELTAGLWHPHIVAVHDRGEFDGQLWIAMDYIDGVQAGELLAEFPQGLPPERVLRIVTAIAEALDYAHERHLLHRDVKPANILIAVALALATPFFVFFGWLSDRIGRKPIILGGCALAAISYFPLFGALTDAANPALAHAQAAAPVTITVNQAECSFQFDPVGKNKFDSSTCDIAKAYMAKAGISYSNADAAPGVPAVVQVGGTSFIVPDIKSLAGEEKKTAIAGFQDSLKAGLKDAGYPAKADSAKINKVAVVAILWALAMLVTMVYGPIAAMLVELFPSRIRYTSMSLPYHIGNGWFGGFLPTTAFAMVAATGNIYYGLWYPVVIAAVTVVIGLLFLPETFWRNIDD